MIQQSFERGNFESAPNPSNIQKEKKNYLALARAFNALSGPISLEEGVFFVIKSEDCDCFFSTASSFHRRDF
jgi:hypothetical protein